jgi:hypothetical protein
MNGLEVEKGNAKKPNIVFKPYLVYMRGGGKGELGRRNAEGGKKEGWKAE